MLFALFTTILSTVVLIPLLTDKKDEKHVNVLFNLFIYFSIILSLISFFILPFIIENQTTVTLSRLLLVQPIIFGLSNLFSSYNQVQNRFLIYSLSPFFYNLATVLSIIFLYPTHGIKGVVYGIIIGALIHLFIQYYSATKNGFILYWQVITENDFKYIKDILRLTIPRSIILTIVQLRLIVVTILLSSFSIGSLAIFNLSYSLQTVPISLFTMSLVIASFPKLTKLYSENNIIQFWKIFKNVLLKITITSVFSMIFILLFKNYITYIIYGDVNNAYDISLIFGILSLSILPVSVELFVTRTYYAMGQNKTPAILSMLSFFILLLGSYMTNDLKSLASVFVISNYISASVFLYNIYRFKNQKN